MKRIFDILCAAFGLILLSPFFLVIAILINRGSKGGVFYKQDRIGRWGYPFEIFKFRTMYPDSDKGRLITVGDRDPRITPTGIWLRKYKLDELPQLWNILKGDMSFVGPRPEVAKYVRYYTPEMQEEILSVRPGLTDYASLQYFEEAALLAASEDPDKTYIQEVLPAKLELSLDYVYDQSFWLDLKLIAQTILRIFKKGKE